MACSFVNQPKYKPRRLFSYKTAYHVLYIIGYAGKRKIVIGMMAFRNVSFKIQIHLFMLLYPPEHILLWSSNLAVYVIRHVYASTIKSHKPLVPLSFEWQ